MVLCTSPSPILSLFLALRVGVVRWGAVSPSCKFESVFPAIPQISSLLSQINSHFWFLNVRSLGAPLHCVIFLEKLISFIRISMDIGLERISPFNKNSHRPKLEISLREKVSQFCPVSNRAENERSLEMDSAGPSCMISYHRFIDPAIISPN